MIITGRCFGPDKRTFATLNNDTATFDVEMEASKQLQKIEDAKERSEVGGVRVLAAYGDEPRRKRDAIQWQTTNIKNSPSAFHFSYIKTRQYDRKNITSVLFVAPTYILLLSRVSSELYTAEKNILLIRVFEWKHSRSRCRTRFYRYRWGEGDDKRSRFSKKKERKKEQVGYRRGRGRRKKRRDTEKER